MKLNLLFLFTLLVMTSCSETLVESLEQDVEDPVLVVNSLCRTDNEINSFSTYLTSVNTPQPLTALATLRVNGEVVAVGKKELNYQFKSGDKAQLQVATSDYYAEGEVEVPYPIDIVRVETERIKKCVSFFDFEMRDYIRLLVYLKMPKEMTGTQYFRLNLKTDRTMCNISGVKEGLVVSYDSLYSTTCIYEYDRDPALCDNEFAVGSDDGDGSSEDVGIFDVTPNKYGLFRSNFFQKGEYTLHVDVPSGLNDETTGGCLNHFRIEVLTIPKIEYMYLNAIANNALQESSMQFSNAPVVPSNIKGGTGIFSVAASTVVELDRTEWQYRIGDKAPENYGYYWGYY